MDKPNPEAFASTHTESFPELLTQLGASLAVTTYHAGRLILIRAENGITTDFLSFDAPMGLAVGVDKLAVGTRTHVTEYLDQPTGENDTLLLPLRTHVTGAIAGRELAYDDEGRLWVANSQFSCLCTLGGDFSFTPAWTPKWVTQLLPEDRCHLNGIGVRDGKVRYATALGRTDSHRGWKEGQATGGVLIDVRTDEVIADGLCVPHSPRWEDGRLWVLESGKGALTMLGSDGSRTVVARVPGFARGLSFAGPFAFVGVSSLRDKTLDSDGLPIIASTELDSGVWAIDTRTGQTVGWLKFTGAVSEIASVQVLGCKRPALLKPDDPRVATSFKFPGGAA